MSVIVEPGFTNIIIQENNNQVLVQNFNVIASGGGGSASWGGITGTLSNQTDLQNALNAKQPLSSILSNTTASFTTAQETKLSGIETGAQVNTVFSVAGKVGSVTLNKSDVGLNNVDNTSDANKPISTAMQTALDGKIDDGATTAEIAPSLNRRYVTDAQLVVIGNTSGINTGDQDLSGYLTISAAALAYQPLSAILTGTTASFTTAQQTKLAGIAAGATVNSPDAFLLNRANHTGTQTASTISDFSTAADARITAQKAAANGLATLGADSKIPTSQLPALAITETFVVASQAAMLALSAQPGDIAVRTDQSKTYILTADPASSLGNWQELLTPTDTVISVNGQTGAVTLTKTDIGLGNVDNTSDVNKPISTATQTALNGKEPSISAGTVSQYWRGDKTFQILDKSAVGLGNVDNTSDANKPVSTATQTALDLKSNLSGATFSGAISATNLSGTNTGDQTTITGNAGSATILQTGRTIGMTGDVVWTSPSFNGSSNVTAAGVLATVNSNVGAFGSASQVATFTVNAKGLTTAAANVSIQITQAQVTNLTSDLALKANLASPTFTGTVTVPASNFTVGASTPFSDSAGTLTLQNVDALDATTESTIEAAIDTLANLTSIQGQSISLSAPLTVPADPNADRIFFWDDSAGATAWLSLGTNLSITGTTLNATGGGSVSWGGITGTLSDQTDLQTALNAKAPLASPTFTGTVTLPAGQVVNGVTLSTAQGTSNFLRGDGTYAAPPGGGGGLTIGQGLMIFNGAVL